MKSFKWEGTGTKNLFPHTSTVRELAHVRGGDAGVGGRQHNGAVGLGETDAAAGQVVVHVVRDESAARSEPRVTRVQVELPFLHRITHATNFTFF